MDTPNTPNKAIIALIVVALLIAAATAVIVLSANNAAKNTSTDVSTSPQASSSTSSSGASANASSSLKDGSYNATGRYQTPGGQEQIGVQVTLSGGVISDTSVTQQGKTGEAQEYQSEFASGFKSQVVGKKISDVSLSRVAGSSLTSTGFNSALNDIQNQAKA